MAEKRVSVRLVAVGGRQVRAELEGVGDAGAKGFGRLTREMELANTRLASFARRAGLALGAAAAAATASLGLIVRSTSESAAQIRQFAQVANATPEALQRWSAGARTVGIEQEKLADILKDVNDRVGDFLQTGGGPMADFFEKVAPRVGVTADQFARLSGPEALQLYVDTLERAGLSQQEMTFHLEAMASDATRLLPLLRNGGAEMARLGDQASDVGAVLDGDALEALRSTQLALGAVSLVFEGLRNRIAVAVAPTIEALANAFVALASDGGILRSAIDTLIGNLGRLAAYAATFATVMAGRWVAGLAVAAFSVRGLATALVFLRGALIRTGIGPLIVGAGGKHIVRREWRAMIRRHPGWQGRLAVWLGTVSRTPFAFGQHDCALFAAGAVAAMTGTDLAAPWRGRYTTLRGGLRLMRRAGHADPIALVAAHFPPTTTPRPGDLAVIATPEGPGLGVVQGTHVYAPAAIGWALVPRAAALSFFEVRD